MEAASDGDTAGKIQDLNDLMRRKPIDRKRGPIAGGILKLLVDGNRQTHGAQIKIEEIRQSLKDFARQRTEEKIFAHGELYSEEKWT